MDRYFIFDDIRSYDLDFHVISIDKEYLKRNTYGGRSIGVKDGFPDIDDGNFVFTIRITKMNYKNQLLEFTDRDIKRLMRWLVHDDFKYMAFSGNISKFYRVMVSEISPLQLDRNGKGFVDVSFISDTNHAYTEKTIYSTSEKHIVGGGGRTSYLIIDAKDMLEDINHPIIEIEGIGSDFNNVRIIDNTIEEIGGGSRNKIVFTISELYDGEIINIDTKNRIIKSNLTGYTDVYSRFKGEWLGIKKGDNSFSIYSNTPNHSPSKISLNMYTRFKTF